MAYTTFSTSIQTANDVSIVDVCNTIRTPFQAGYVQTRAKNQHMIKRFRVSWAAMDSANWKTLLRFWYARKGGAEAFYYQFPVAVVTTAIGAGTTQESDIGWDSPLAHSSAEGPKKLVRFADDELPQAYLKEVGRYEVVINLETV